MLLLIMMMTMTVLRNSCSISIPRCPIGELDRSHTSCCPWPRWTGSGQRLCQMLCEGFGKHLDPGKNWKKLWTKPSQNPTMSWESPKQSLWSRSSKLRMSGLERAIGTGRWTPFEHWWETRRQGYVELWALLVQPTWQCGLPVFFLKKQV